MNLFLVNVLLAILWALVSGDISLASLLTGFVVGALVLLIAGRALGSSRYLLRLWRAIAYLGFFVRELFLSSLKVAYDVLTPTHYMRPGVVAVPLDLATDGQRTLLANTLSLTPGTLSLDLSPDKSVLYIHAMYVEDRDALRASIKQNYERRVKEVLG